ncbi:hypothetical protein AB0J38_11370 [Streptomyces sp. NPDC050095]
MQTMLDKVNADEELAALPVETDEASRMDSAPPVLATPLVAAAVLVAAAL